MLRNWISFLSRIRIKELQGKIFELVVEKIILLHGYLAIFLLFLIFILLLRDGFPFLFKYNFFQALTGLRWYPISRPPSFGMLPLIAGSLTVTLGAIIIALPLGVATAFYIAEVAPRRIQGILKTLVESLAAIPSVVIGFLGLIVLAPYISRIFEVSSGQTALLASIMLAIMSLPTIISVAEDAIKSVPQEYREASYALGANQWQTLRKVIGPTASPGIFAAVMLGMGRVIGETMTVLMVTGNAAILPKIENYFWFQPVRTLTGTIAQEMGEVVPKSTHYHALFMIGLILFLITFAINLLADIALHQRK